MNEEIIFLIEQLIDLKIEERLNPNYRNQFDIDRIKEEIKNINTKAINK